MLGKGMAVIDFSLFVHTLTFLNIHIYYEADLSSFSFIFFIFSLKSLAVLNIYSEKIKRRRKVVC